MGLEDHLFQYFQHGLWYAHVFLKGECGIYFNGAIQERNHCPGVRFYYHRLKMNDRKIVRKKCCQDSAKKIKL